MVDKDKLAAAIAAAVVQALTEEEGSVPTESAVPSSSVEDTLNPIPPASPPPTLILPKQDSVKQKLRDLTDPALTPEVTTKREPPPLVAVGKEAHSFILEISVELEPEERAAATALLTRLGAALKHWNSEHMKVQLKDNSGWEDHAKNLLFLLQDEQVVSVMQKHLPSNFCAAISEASAMLMTRMQI